MFTSIKLHKTILLCILVTLGILVIAFCVGKEKQVALRIIHINDLHGHLLPHSYETFGANFSKVVTLVNTLSQTRAPTITIAAGDHIAGSAEIVLLEPEEGFSILNTLDLDYIGVGNHEFDFGDSHLASFIERSNATVLTGNTRSSHEDLSSKLKSHDVITLDNKQIGIISVLPSYTHQISNPSPQTIFDDELEFLSSTTNALREAGIDIILIISHLGIDQDRKIAQKVAGIDVIIGGHTNTFMSNNHPEAEYAYPLLEIGPDGTAVPIIQTLPEAAAVGYLDVRFDRHGNILDAHGNSILIDENLESDPRTSSALEKINTDSFSQEILFSNYTISGDREICFRKQCEVGTLVLNSMMQHSPTDPVDFALYNSGAIRSSIPSGSVTTYDVLNALPFQDTAQLTRLSGAQIIDVLEYQSRFGFVQKTCPVCDARSECTILPDTTYTIIANSFLLKDTSDVVSEDVSSTTIQDMVISYLQNPSHRQPSSEHSSEKMCDLNYTQYD